MPLSDGKDFKEAEKRACQRLETLLAQLLKRHTQDQKQLKTLLEENQRLKEALRKENGLERVAQKAAWHAQHQSINPTCRDALVQKINRYIQEIDDCLSYFEQI